MICPQCLSKIPDKALKCRHCGSRVGMGTYTFGCLATFIIIGIICIVVWIIGTS